MKEMISSSLTNKNHKILVAVKKNNDVIGHSIISMKTDNNNILYGFCFSRFIQREYRRLGIGSQLLPEAEKWWIKNGAG